MSVRNIMHQNTVKKIPERKCMGCNEKKPKKQLIRIVRTPEGEVVLDTTGKRSGRESVYAELEKYLSEVSDHEV